jgi:hypothetical protein
MTDRELMQMALDAMENGCVYGGKQQVAIQTLRDRLAQPEPEPMAAKIMMRWVNGLKRLSNDGIFMNIPSGLSAGDCMELALELEQFIKTAPPKREWVGLTDEEFEEILAKYNEALPMVVCRAFEAKLKEKNT